MNNVFQPEHWQKLAIADDSLGLDLMVDGARIARYETTNRWGSLWALSGRDYPSPSSVYYDNFRIRKYAAAEPAAEVGAAGADVVVSSEGAHVVGFYSEDLNGKAETPKSVSFKLDRTPPAVAAAPAPPANQYGWNNGPVTVNFTGEDAVSGVAWCSPAAVLAAEGRGRAAAGYCADYAGLSSTAVYTADIDTTPPAIAYTLPDPQNGGWYNAANRLRFGCSDALSGLRICSSSGPVETEGVNVSTAARAEDFAGNATEVTLTGLKIDNGAPVSTATLTGLSGGAMLFRSPVAVTLTAADAVSGVRERYYLLDDGPVTPYAGGIQVSSEGSHKLEYFAVDNAGNPEPLNALSFTIDSLPPVSTAAAVGAGGNGWYNGDVSVNIESSDQGSGVEAVYYSVDGGSVTALSSAGVLPAGWLYGERLRVAERSGAALYDHQVAVTLNTADLIASGKMRADCGDLRFYQNAAQLDYWLEGGCGTAETRVWVKVSSLPAGGLSDVSMIYGNPSALSASSGLNTFDFFDDFDENYVDYLRWRTVGGACPMYVRGGKLEFAACSTGATLTKPWMVPLNSRPEKYVMETGVYGLNYGGDNAQAQIIALRWDGNFIGPNNPANGYILATFTGGSPMGAVSLVRLASEYGVAAVAGAENALFPEKWQTLGITDDAQSLDVSVDGRTVVHYDTTNRWGDLWALSGRDYPAPSSVYYDNFRIRKYAAAQPSVERGAPGGVVTVSGPGFHAVRYFAKDAAGNTESEKMLVFNISGGAGAPAASPDGAVSVAGSTEALVIAPVAAPQAPAAAVAAAAPAQGVQPVSGFYEITPSGLQFGTPVKLTFIFDPAGQDISAVGIYYFDGVAWTSAPVSGVTTGLLADGRAYVEGYISHTSLYAAMRAVDGKPPSSRLAAPWFERADGVRFASDRTVFSLTSLDDLAAAGDGRGFGVRAQHVAVSTGAAPLREFDWTSAEPGFGRAEVSTFSLAGLVDGAYFADYSATDLKGHEEALKRLEISLDNTPPSAAASLAGTPGANGWYVSTITAALAAEDAGAGVEKISYRLAPPGEEPGPEAAYEAPLGAELEGVYRLYFKAADVLGNTSIETETRFGIDLSTPVVSAALVPAPNAAGWNNTAVYVSFAGTDAVSGIAYCAAGSTVSLEGAARELSGYCLDYAGWSSTASVAVNIDTTPPAIGFTLPGAASPAGWYNGDVTARFACSDALSGLLSCPEAVTLAGEGPGISTSVAASDKAGNVSTVTASVNIDRTPPEIHISSPAAGDVFVATKDKVRTFFAVKDNLDPAPEALAYLEQVEDRGSPRGGRPAKIAVVNGQALEPLDLDDGLWELAAGATDFALNTSTAAGGTFEIIHDVRPPRSALAVSGGPLYEAGGTAYISKDTVLSLASADDLVLADDGAGLGVRRQLVSVPGRGWSFENPEPRQGAVFVSTFALDAQADGLYFPRYNALDVIGNEEAVKVSTFALDNTAPASALSVSGDQYHGGGLYVSTRSLVVITAADPAVNGAASGVRVTSCAVDGGAFAEYAAFGLSEEGRRLVAYYSADSVNNVEAVKTSELWVDSTTPVTALTVSGARYDAGGLIYITGASGLALAAADPVSNGAASGVLLTKHKLDGGDWRVYAGSFTITAEGRHTLEYYSLDRVQNAEQSRTALLAVDNTPPATALSASGVNNAAGGVVYVNAGTRFQLSAADPSPAGEASGVKASRYEISGADGVEAAGDYAAPFALGGTDGPKVIKYYSVDNVGNAEAAKTAAYTLDATPPAARLLCPGAAEGVCRIFKGTMTVLGEAGDLNFAWYRLEYAAGREGTEFRAISVGTAPVSGALARWSAPADGYYTLRLTVTDLAGNGSTAAAVVYSGEPALRLALGGEGMFKAPSGAAVDGAGNIYVADTGNDRIAVYTSTGGLKAVYGGEAEGGKEDKKKGRGGLALKKPEGTAVDAAGNIYVADTGNDRVLRLSAAGAVTLELGGVRDGEGDGDDHYSVAPSTGTFKRPAGVAADGAGNVYVADTGNGRVQKFGADGAFLLAIALPPAETREADEPGDEAEGGKPEGIAVDGAGNIYVADGRGRRALKYGPDGTLAAVLKAGGKARGGDEDGDGRGEEGGFGEPYGIAVDAAGGCLLVGDRHSGLVYKFDGAGNVNLVFGGRAAGARKKGEKRGEDEAFSFPEEPLGLALDAEGGLYIADPKGGRVLKYGQPDGTPPVVIAPSAGEKKRVSALAAAGGGGTYEVLAGPDPAFRLGEVYVFPNPALRGAAPTLHIEAGIADRVKITFYTVSGRHAHEAVLTGQPVPLDDGNGLAYAYEYTWRDSIPSGVYYYYVEAEKGGAKIKKSGKFAVVR